MTATMAKPISPATYSTAPSSFWLSSFSLMAESIAHHG